MRNNPAAPYETPEAFAAGLAEVRAAAAKAGRDPAALDVGMLAIRCTIGAEQKGRDGGRLRFTGSAQAVVDDVGAFAKVGLKHLVIGGESGDVNQALDRVEQFATQVMAKAG